MSRPKTKGEPLSFRLSIEAYEELCRRAEKAGMTPQEHLIASLERSLRPSHDAGLKKFTDEFLEKAPRHEVTDTFRPDDFERNEVTVKMEPPPQFEKPFDITHVIKPGENTETRIDGFEVHVPLRQFLGLEPPKDDSHLDELDEQCIPPDCPVVTPEEVEATYTVVEQAPFVQMASGGVYQTDEGEILYVANEPQKFGKHPSWRLNSIGVNVCTACGEPKGTARQLCTGNPL